MHESLDEHMMERIMANNDEFASHNREHFDENGTFVLNIMSAPGAGKTSLLEVTTADLANEHTLTVVEGDMVGELDAERLRKNGTTVHQICTGRSCHLDALMIGRLLHAEEIKSEILFVENVGNLVCPAEFQLGEHKRVVLLSVTEGDDKPIKYPIIFRNCDAVIFTKTDLLPYVNFKPELASEYIHNLNSGVKIFQLSSLTLEGVGSWIDWLNSEYANHIKNLQVGRNVPISAC